MRKTVARWVTGITASSWRTLIWAALLIPLATALSVNSTTPANITLQHADDTSDDVFESNSTRLNPLVTFIKPLPGTAEEKPRKIDEGCQRFLHCQGQMMAAYRQCTGSKQPRPQLNTSDPNCSTDSQMASLHHLVDLRLQEHSACVEKLSAADLSHKRLDGETAQCRAPIAPLDQLNNMHCWRAILITHRQCRVLRRCCPQANVCMRKQRSSPLVRKIHRQQSDLRSQIEECKESAERKTTGGGANVPIRLLKRPGKHSNKARQNSARTLPAELPVHDHSYHLRRRVFHKSPLGVDQTEVVWSPARRSGIHYIGSSRTNKMRRFRPKGRLFASDRWEKAKTGVGGRRSRGKNAKKSVLDSELGWVPSRLGIWPYRGNYDREGIFREEQALAASSHISMGRVQGVQPIRQRQSFTLPANFNLTTLRRARPHLSLPPTRRLHGTGFFQYHHSTTAPTSFSPFQTLNDTALPSLLQSVNTTTQPSLLRSPNATLVTPPSPVAQVHNLTESVSPKLNNSNATTPVVARPVFVDNGVQGRVAHDLVRNLEEYLRRRLLARIRRRNRLHAVNTRPVQLKMFSEQDGDLIGLAALEQQLSSISLIRAPTYIPTTTRVRKPNPYPYFSPYMRNLRVFQKTNHRTHGEHRPLHKKHRRIYAGDRPAGSTTPTRLVATNERPTDKILLDGETPRSSVLLTNVMPNPTLIPIPPHFATPRPIVMHPTLIATPYRPATTPRPTLVTIPYRHLALTAAPRHGGRLKTASWRPRMLSSQVEEVGTRKVKGDTRRPLPPPPSDRAGIVDGGDEDVQQHELYRLKISKMTDSHALSRPPIGLERPGSYRGPAMVSGGNTRKDGEEEGLVELGRTDRRGPLEVIPVESTLVASDLVMNLEEYVRRHSSSATSTGKGPQPSEPNMCDQYALCADRLRVAHLKCDASAALAASGGVATGAVPARCRQQIVQHLALIDNARRELGKNIQECLKGGGVEPIDGLIKLGIGFRNFVDRYFGSPKFLLEEEEQMRQLEGSCDPDHLSKRREVCEATGRRCGTLDSCRSQKSMLARRLRIEEERLEKRTKLCRRGSQEKTSRLARRIRI